MNNINVNRIKKLCTPYELKNDINIDYDDRIFINNSRTIINNILKGTDDRKLVIVGPCSIHNFDLALDYANHIKKMQADFPNIFIVMRAYFEKPRTIKGWKGFLYDPELDGSNNIHKGLEFTRKLLLKITKLKIPIATEFLDTIIPQYIDDLISWGCIGARTVESQLHIQLASGLSIAIGYKNRTDGNIDIATNAILSSLSPHSFMGIDINGSASVIDTSGNDNYCIVLRGGDKGSNFTKDNIKITEDILEKNNLRKSIIVDVSHDNSIIDGKKVYSQQINNVKLIRKYWLNNIHSIKGIMIESNIYGGKQVISDNLKYGVSITDGCISIIDTYKLLESINEKYYFPEYIKKN